MGLSWTESRRNDAPLQPRLPDPEQVFLAWLVAQPDGGNLHEAASQQANRLAEFGGGHSGPRRLQQMFLELINELDTDATSSKITAS